jgi:biotin carboxyl carrier protein
MKLEVRINGRTRRVELAQQVQRDGARRPFVARIDDRHLETDAVEIAPGAYSILLGGRAFEAHIQSEGDALRIFVGEREFTAQVFDPRVWRGRRGGALELEGRQQIAAPMPGKIVRLLVAQGARVEAGQGLLVVEAMKMQNEIRSPKSGVVERLLVTEGQAVNAGEIIAIVA